MRVHLQCSNPGGSTGGPEGFGGGEEGIAVSVGFLMALVIWCLT